MTDFVRVLDFSNKFSSNVMPKTSILEDGTPYNVTSGTGTLAFEQNAEYGNFINVTCQSYKTTDLTFNFNDKLATPVIDILPTLPVPTTPSKVGCAFSNIEKLPTLPVATTPVVA